MVRRRVGGMVSRSLRNLQSAFQLEGYYTCRVHGVRGTDNGALAEYLIEEPSIIPRVF